MITRAREPSKVLLNKETDTTIEFWMAKITMKIDISIRNINFTIKF